MKIGIILVSVVILIAVIRFKKKPTDRQLDVKEHINSVYKKLKE